MKTLTTTFTVEIRNINVDQDYFSFEYKVVKDGEIVISEGVYDDDHVWRNDTEMFEKILQNGHAVSLALETILQ